MEGTAAIKKKDLREAIRALSAGMGRLRGSSKRTARLHLLIVGENTFRIAHVGTQTSSSMDMKATLITGHLDVTVRLAWFNSVVMGLKSDTVRIWQDAESNVVRISDGSSEFVHLPQDPLSPRRRLDAY